MSETGSRRRPLGVTCASPNLAARLSLFLLRGTQVFFGPLLRYGAKFSFPVGRHNDTACLLQSLGNKSRPSLGDTIFH